MTQQINLQEEVMMRVRAVYFLRRLASSPYTSALFLSIFIFIANIMVSISDVFSNAMNHQDFLGGLSYILHSLLHSKLIIQALAFLILISFFAIFFRIFGGVFVGFFRKTTRVFIRRAI